MVAGRGRAAPGGGEGGDNFSATVCGLETTACPRKTGQREDEEEGGESQQEGAPWFDGPMPLKAARIKLGTDGVLGVGLGLWGQARVVGWAAQSKSKELPMLLRRGRDLACQCSAECPRRG